jgi:hypothetical protein
VAGDEGNPRLGGEWQHGQGLVLLPSS